MADTKITGLDPNTTPAVGDLLVMVDDPGGSAATQKMTIAALLALAVSNVTMQVIGAGSGDYTPTTGMKKVLIILVGGGGGGGSVTGTDSYGGGGGGGGTCIRLCTAAEIAANHAYVVGAASAAGGAGNNSTFSCNTMVANGGAVGVASADSTTLGTLGAGGAGGTASGGDLNIPGQAGQRGVVYSTSFGLTGMGGNSMFGGGAAQAVTESAGANGGAYGGGGSGGGSSAGTDRAGGAGAAGVMYCIEFLNV
jgi:hypothetical protein